jgi:hypothetical protein
MALSVAIGMRWGLVLSYYAQYSHIIFGINGRLLDWLIGDDQRQMEEQSRKC